MPGEHLDLTNEPSGDDDASKDTASRSFVGIQFKCCRVYSRIFVDDTLGSTTVARCPKCMRPIEIRIAADGSEQRVYSVE